ncbi:MAG TPA: universal stress protein [Gemmatimonadales bacterium]|nr:universal stress protein [Gemmatimonadales bacterium]
MNAPLRKPARILVPLDGSPFSEQALDPAVEIARRSGAELRLVRVHIPYVSGLEVADVDLRADQEAALSELASIEKTAERITATLGRPVIGELLQGEVATTIAGRADEWSADLVIMTTHARGPAARFWLGSIADRLLRTLTRPLLLIPPRAGARPELQLRQILVPLDGSTLSESVVAEARKVGALFGASYILYEAVEEPTPIVDPSGMIVALADPEPMEARLAAARSHLEKPAEAIRAGGGTATVVAAGADGPASGILAAAAAAHADLIAMATHGRSGLQRFWLGSVADKVIRGSQVPLLILHPPA